MPGQSEPPATVTGHVSYVIDGDTIIVQLTGGDRVHVRLIGIDTPEISHSAGEASDCWGQAATRITRRLADDHDVVLTVGHERHDRYGRLLAYVADAYLEGYFQRNPDQATLFGVPGRHHDVLDLVEAGVVNLRGILARLRPCRPGTARRGRNGRAGSISQVSGRPRRR